MGRKARKEKVRKLLEPNKTTFLLKLAKVTTLLKWRETPKPGNAMLRKRRKYGGEFCK